MKATSIIKSLSNGLINLKTNNCISAGITQMGLLRLLTQPSVMAGDVKSLRQAWYVFDTLQSDSRIASAIEPTDEELESLFRKFSSTHEIFPKRWSDAYLLAFAGRCGLELVTFDRALAQISRTGKYLH